ncbi:MAG: hypothetical protein IKP28_00320 [Clostridia bacterium]|nr:hypothetical protein [Clostridia bacterium]
MKIQNLAIIFVLIVIPVSLTLSYYVRTEIDTLQLQAKYDEILISSVEDAIKAYQINTANNNFAILSASQKRDIEASINTFLNGFATGLGVGGYGVDYTKSYVPAIIFTLYDGYYMYAPTIEDNGTTKKIEHVLKPYFAYTAHYVSDNTQNSSTSKSFDIEVSYTLDNYVTIIGTIGNDFVYNSGFLIDDTTSIFSNEEDMKESLKEWLYIVNKDGTTTYKEFKYIYLNGSERYYYDDDADGSEDETYFNKTGIVRHWFMYRKGQKQYYTLDLGKLTAAENNQYEPDLNALKYSKESKEFTDWVHANLWDVRIGNLKLVNEQYTDRFYNYGSMDTSYRIFNPNASYEDENSVFNIHKRDIIKNSIKENISAAITSYNNHSVDLFQVPILEETEWDQIARNICMVAFVQGIPVGVKTYNNYAIINNAKNTSYTALENLVFVETGANGEETDATGAPLSDYHRIDCPRLSGTNIRGYREVDFDPVTVEIGGSVKQQHSYYRHKNLPCYYCMVERNYTAVDINDATNVSNSAARIKAKELALGRERRINTYASQTQKRVP